MNPLVVNEALNAVLRIVDREGFVLKVEHPLFGVLSLPISNAEAILKVSGGELETVPESELEVLEQKCVAFAKGGNADAGFSLAEAFVERHPLAHRAYYLKSVFAERMGGIVACPFYLRQAVAVKPDFMYLLELGRVLGKVGKLKESKVVFSHVYRLRKTARDEEEVRRVFREYLITLTRLKCGQEMTEVADVGIAEFGESSYFQYQAILGLMIEEEYKAGKNRLEKFRPRLLTSDPLFQKFDQLSGVLEAKLKELGPNGLSSKKKTVLNSVLKLEDRGFSVEFKHRNLGSLLLPMDHSSIGSEKELGKVLVPSQAVVDQLVTECQLLVEQKDLKGAYARCGDFLREFPLSAYPHRLQGAYSEGLQDFKLAAGHLRKAAAIEPDFGTLTDLGRVLWKAEEVEQSVVVLGYLFSIRSEAPSSKSSFAVLIPLMAALSHLRRGEELRAVCQASIESYGPNEPFEYYAVLGELYCSDFDAGRRRLMAVESRFRPEGPWKEKLLGLKEIIEAKLSGPKKTPSPVGVELVLGKQDFSGPFETFTFYEGRLTVVSENDPNAKLVFELMAGEVDEHLKRLISGDFMAAARKSGRPDSMLRFLGAADSAGKSTKLNGVVFSKDSLLNEAGKTSVALSKIMDRVEAVWSYRVAGDLPDGLKLLNSGGGTMQGLQEWEAQDVLLLEYEIGNEHNPADKLGRQVVCLTPDDRFQVTWHRKNQMLKSEGLLHPGLVQTLFQQLKVAGFPEVPQKSPPAGAAMGEYRLTLPGGILRASVLPSQAGELSGLKEVQQTLNRLTRELGAGAPALESTLIVTMEDWQ